jgi:hypothetical protein
VVSLEVHVRRRDCRAGSQQHVEIDTSGGGVIEFDVPGQKVGQVLRKFGGKQIQLFAGVFDNDMAIDIHSEVHISMNFFRSNCGFR